jgi:hypothetical protein
MAQNTISFELSRGYIDTEGNAHKLVELRAPTINDEVIADRKLAMLSASPNPEQRAEGNSETLWELEVMAACCLKLGSIIKVTSDHIRQLARSDARLMLAKLNEVEAKLMKAESAPNSSTGEQGSSSSPSSASTR